MITLLISALLAAMNPAVCELQPGEGETVSLKVLTKGAMSRFGFFSPLRLNLASVQPATITKAPSNLAAPLYGVIQIAAEGTPTYHVILDEPSDGPSRFFVDTNGDGDFTNDPEAAWKSKDIKGKDANTYKQYEGAAVLDIGTTAAPMPVSLGVYRFDKKDPSRAPYAFTLMYYRDYATEGDMKLGDKTYHVLLNDSNAGGDFRGKPLPESPSDRDSSGVQIAIDVNGNGKFEKRGEAFDVRKPFNIGGTTYELRDIARNGLSFRVVKSDKQVAEIPLAPEHTVGKKITPFSAKDMDGKAVKFPTDFKGKIVMVDFWATWCKPCMLEVPGLVKVYQKFHSKGFEVLGVTLDNAGDDTKILSTTKDQGMTWRQIFDGKGWNADIVKLYVVQSIPATFLVDGDTGEILALAADLRGEKLERTIENAIKRKFPQ